MGRPRNAHAPTAHDEQVRAVVGALAPASLDLTKLRARAANADDVRPVRANKRDVLAAFGEGPRLGQLIYRARWNRERSRHLVECAALLLVTDLTKRRSRRQSVTMRILALTAIAEYIEGDCADCEGRGKKRRGDAMQLAYCTACHGTGKISLGEFQRAANLGVSVEAYRNGWAAKYNRALALLARAERDTATAIDLKLGKPQYRVRASEESYAASDESDMPGEHEDSQESEPSLPR